MRMFLLKQMEKITQKSVAIVPNFFYKPSIYASSIIAIAAAVVVSPVYAGEQLSDAELDTKFIEVQIKQICTLEKESVDTKKSAYITEDATTAKYTCRTDDLFVTAIKSDSNEESKKLRAASGHVDQSADSSDANPLLAGIIQNLRSFGGGEFSGVPTGVANTGNPVLFGSERYSYKWAGNLGDIFKPVYSGGVMAPYSVYDYSDLGYGFRAEAHFPYQIPSPTIQAVNRN